VSALPPDSLAGRLARAVAEDLRLLAHLHDRELDGTTLSALRSQAFPDNLALVLESEPARAAMDLLRSALNQLELDAGAKTMDLLAVDYAAIYLNHTLRAAPNESVWIDEEELAMQAPMFEVREWMARHALTVENWRVRPEDHLVHELEFLACILESEPIGQALEEAADFLDRHLLRWVPDFSRRVAARCETPFYAGLNALTGCHLDEVRDLLAEMTGAARPTREEIEARIAAERPAGANSGTVEMPLRFVPGASPSW
jgi:putative dimethyl sulfoxide reductase chaperone